MAEKSKNIYLEIPTKEMAMFRFLLEAYDNVAMFTVIAPKKTLLKLIFSPHDEKYVYEILESMKKKVSFQKVF